MSDSSSTGKSTASDHETGEMDGKGNGMTDVALNAPEIDIDNAEMENKAADPWDVLVLEDTSTKWKDLTSGGKALRVLWIFARIIFILTCLYFFICSLDVLQDAFQMLSGRSAGSLFKNSILVANPVSATMLGVFVTVVVQSSSTSTSIVVSMVASGIIDVKDAVPIVMGANIGTTVTNTIVALTQSSDKNVFRRAFAGATVHDAFNWLTVLILLPLECATSYLFILTEKMTENISPSPKGSSDAPQFLKVITDPLTKKIIQIDKKVITAVAEGSDRGNFPLAKYWCKEVLQYIYLELPIDEGRAHCLEAKSAIFKYNVVCDENNSTNTSYLNYTEINQVSSTKCDHIFVGAGLEGYISEALTGIILLIGSLLVMTSCLIILVKILNTLFKGPVTGIIKKALNADFPGCFSYFTGYVVMLVGAIITILFQSSSVFTSALTPLVGMGLITVERVYPLTLGSNIGTTVTSMLAAFTADADVLRYTIQIALCHLFFNISGIVLFYPIPFTRVPIPIAKMLGNITAKYRWFAVFYLVVMFGCFPLFVFGLSMAGPIVFMAVGIPLLVLTAFVVLINVLQVKKPEWLPRQLQNWDFLPKPLHSLEPYDRLFTKCCCCRRCRNDDIQEVTSSSSVDHGVENPSYSADWDKTATNTKGTYHNGDCQASSNKDTNVANPSVVQVIIKMN